MKEMSREYKDQAYQMLAKVGKAVSSPKRLEILDILTQGSKTVDAIAKEADMCPLRQPITHFLINAVLGE